METAWMEVTISLDPEDYRFLKKQAEEKDLSVSVLIRQTVLDFMREEERLMAGKQKAKTGRP